MNNMDECLFCKLLKEKDNPSFIADMDGGRLIVNHSQTYNGRCIYIQKRHTTDITGAKPDELETSIKEIAVIARVLKQVYKPYIMNTAIASLGNEVPHLHWHLIPRYVNENNFGKPPWPHQKQFISPDECKIIADTIYQELKNYQDRDFTIKEIDPKQRILTLRTSTK